MAAPLLRIRGLCVDARTRRPGRGFVLRRIVKDLSLGLDRGQVLGLIGESGAGKSTLGLAAMGYARRGCRISHGEIRLDGLDLRTAGPGALLDVRGRRVAYVAQSAAAAFNPAHRLLGQVLEVTRIHGGLDRERARARAIGLFERMALPDPERFGDRYPHEVSGGQLQRAMTAMALAGEPDLIVFDEPTTALDVTTQIEVLAIIREVVREVGAAALYISHDLAVVAQIADRIKVLRDGEEIEEQPAGDLLEAPGHAYTRALLGVRSAAPKAPAPRTVPILEVRSIRASYGRVRVLHDVDLTVHRGRSLAVVGESGSGKSTLARVICGLLPPRSGSLWFDGAPLPRRLADRGPEVRRRIQLVYQNPDVAMNPRHTIGDVVGRPVEVFLGAGAEHAAERRSLLRYQVDELRGLGDIVGRADELAAEHRRLHRARDLIASAGNAQTELEEQLVGAVARLADNLERADDEPLRGATELLLTAQTHLEEALGELRRYMESFPEDDGRAAELDSQLRTLHDMARKHGVAASDLGARRAELSAELENIASDEARVEALEARAAAAHERFQTAALALSEERRAAADPFCEQVGGVLAELGVKGATLQVEFAQGESAAGLEQVEFKVRTNPRFPAGPLAAIASGGELARLSLAIDVVAAARSKLPCLILDEADVGVGGTGADVLGRMLRRLSNNTQVIVVTHAPQIAALGDHHFRVSKTSAHDTVIENLSGRERTEELARMLGGRTVTDDSRAYARTLLAQADQAA